MSAALAFLIAAAVALSCALAAIVAIIVISCGLITLEEATSPVAITLFVFLVCLLLALIVSAAIRATVIKPVCGMTSAMQNLAKGDFSRRISEDALGKVTIREVRDFAKSYNVTAEELAGVEMMKTSFIGDFTHEFRTPIASIAGFSQLLRDPDLSEEERGDYLSVIEEEAMRLTGLSERILLLSRMESKAVLADVEDVDVSEQIRRAILILEPKSDKKDVDFVVNLDECCVRGNADYLAHLWLNLLDNAVKFSPAGGTVSVALYEGPRSGDGRFANGSEAVCWISDEGCGMSADARKHLFDKFYQEDASRSTEGNGLGLALCKKVVDLHDGSISVDSRTQGGTVFEVRLPIC